MNVLIVMYANPNVLIKQIYQGEAIYEIDPNRCTECQGHFDAPQCREVCPVDCIPINPNHQETQTQLIGKVPTSTG